MKTINIRQMSLILLLLAFLIPALACRLSLKAPSRPGDPIPISTEAAGRFAEEIQKAAEQVQQGGQVEVSFSEAELTSYVALQIQDRADLPISNPQIYLRDGKVQFFADYNSGSLNVPMRAVFLPQVDAFGNADISLETLDLGPVAAPETISERIQQEISQAFRLAVDEAISELFVESLVIQNGELNLIGSKR